MDAIFSVGWSLFWYFLTHPSWVTQIPQSNCEADTQGHCVPTYYP